jgi:GntR family transcriptional repressor for pyruvate dehydrogenase complex
VPADQPIDRDAGRGLAHELVERLKERILAGQMEPGQKLPTEAALVADFGVSRTVVREAISRLQAAGLVETFQGRGSFVLALPEARRFEVGADRVRTHRDVLDVIDFRIGIEGEAAGLAAERRTDIQLKAIERALRELNRAGESGTGAVEADYEFHLRIAVASGNRFYSDLLASLGPMMIMLPRTRLEPAYTVSDATHLTRVALEHENIHLAIIRGDGMAARAAMRLHLANSRARLIQG